MKIWLDDLRPAPEGFLWCHSVNEAKRVIAEAEKRSRSSALTATTISATMPPTVGTGSGF